MPRGYRLVIIAVVGCLIISLLFGWLLQPEQPHLTGDGGYREQSTAYQTGGARCQPAAIDRLAAWKRQAKRDACAEAQEQHREATNSLIEARRSADAADASAIATYKQTGIAGWQAGIGLLTLYAAAAAAIFAERAAHYTKMSANTAHNQTRPWVKIVRVKISDARIASIRDDGSYLIEATAKMIVDNFGGIPARNAIFFFVPWSASEVSHTKTYGDAYESINIMYARHRPTWHGETLFTKDKHRFRAVINIECSDELTEVGIIASAHYKFGTHNVETRQAFTIAVADRSLGKVTRQPDSHIT